MATTITTLSNFARKFNPLRGLTKSQIDQMMDNARDGNDAKLQLAYSMVEQTMPIFGVCIQKRIAGIQSRKWDIIPTDDSEEARIQADTVKKIFLDSDLRCTDGLTDAIAHLGLATFRGRSAVKPFMDDAGLRFKTIQNWNLLLRGSHVYFATNPENAVYSDSDWERMPIVDDEVMLVKEQLPVDMPGIQIYLRQLVGEETWAKTIEKYGVAQVLLTTPEGTPDSAMPEWSLRAQKIMEGGSGSIPFGTKVDQLTEARAQDPFSEYIQHQMEMISILATGGTLATIGGSTGLGSNLAEVQDDQFQSLINNDCRRIANAMSAVAVKKVCEYLGYETQRCRFQYVETDDTSAAEYIKMATELKALGATINMSKLKELTRLDFIELETSAGQNDSNIWQPSNEVKENDE